MEEFYIIYRALQNWRKIQDVRMYRDVQWCRDPEHILDDLSWPLPPFQEFFEWALKQPGLHLPHLTLEGWAPARFAVNFDVDTVDEEVSGSSSDEEATVDVPSQDVPVVTVFAHSDKFEKYFNPAHGVSVRTSDNLGIGDMRNVIAKFQDFLTKHADAPLVHLNLLVYCGVTSPSEKFLKSTIAMWKQKQPIIMTIFSMTRDLHWYKLDHKLILDHQVLTKSEVETKLVSKGIDPKKLPHIRACDPVVQLLALRAGTVVQIKVPLDSIEDYIYRIVVESGAEEDEAPDDEDDAPDDST